VLRPPTPWELQQYDRTLNQNKEKKVVIDDLEEVIAQSKKETNVALLLDESRTKNPIDPYFVCLMCHSIVKPPVRKCAKCEVLFCNLCMVNWQDREMSKCPAGCGQNPSKTVNLSRYERNSLNEVEFNCFRCGVIFKYRDLMKHAEDCSSFNCPANCGIDNFITKE
jgi:hypothetical protein